MNGLFGLKHLILLAVCVAAIVGAYFAARKWPLEKLTKVLFSIGVVSEFIKVFYYIIANEAAYGGVLPKTDLPFHLCSIQILFICYTCFAKDGKLRDAILAFMYPTCTIGATFPLFIPTVFTESVNPAQAFTHPMPYQFFLYHVMLIILGIYIYHSGAVDLRPKHYLSTMGILGGLAFLSFYLNSIFASPTYQNGELVSVDYTTNFFFTHHPPIDIPLTQEWHWFLYIGILIVLAFLLIALFYIPVFRRAKKK